MTVLLIFLLLADLWEMDLSVYQTFRLGNPDDSFTILPLERSKGETLNELNDSYPLTEQGFCKSMCMHIAVPTMHIQCTVSNKSLLMFCLRECCTVGFKLCCCGLQLLEGPTGSIQ